MRQHGLPKAASLRFADYGSRLRTVRERFRMLFFKNSAHLGHYFHMRNPVTKLMRYSIFAIQRIVEPKELKGRGNNPHSGGTSVQFNMIVWGMKPSR